MKYFYILLNSLLIVLIIVSAFFKPNEKSISTDVLAKSVTTSVFSAWVSTPEPEPVPEQVEEVVEEAQPSVVEEAVQEFEQAVSNRIVSASVATDVLETQVGSLSAYGPDCAGCSGHLAGGYDATGGNTTYYDATYGEVHVVAADRSYPFGTIVRIKGTNYGDVNAIVLDRGGGIGFGKRFLFDFLCSSEASASEFGSHHGITFEILRYGY